MSILFPCGTARRFMFLMQLVMPVLLVGLVVTVRFGVFFDYDVRARWMVAEYTVGPILCCALAFTVWATTIHLAAFWTSWRTVSVINIIAFGWLLPVLCLLVWSDPSGADLSFMLRLPVHFYEFFTVVLVQLGMVGALILSWSYLTLRTLYLILTNQLVARMT